MKAMKVISLIRKIVLLPDSGKNDDDECLYECHNFLWEDMDDYSGLTKILLECVDLKTV
jgi:hypothetical protein